MSKTRILVLIGSLIRIVIMYQCTGPSNTPKRMTFKTLLEAKFKKKAPFMGTSNSVDYYPERLLLRLKRSGPLTAAKSLQSCLTLCDPIDSSPPDSPIPGILQASTGVGCHFLLQCVKVKLLSRVRLLVTSWTAAYQAPQSMGFSRQEYWSGVPLPSPGPLTTSLQILALK